MNKEYNGWTNYETWAVALWIDNTPGGYYSEQAEECVRRAKAGEGNPYADNVTNRAAMLLADSIKADHETSMQDMLDNSHNGASVWADLLGAAISEVNWREIAEHYMEDIETEEEAA